MHCVNKLESTIIFLQVPFIAYKAKKPFVGPDWLP